MRETSKFGRRGFLSGLLVFPAVVVAAPAGGPVRKQNGLRLSIEKDDPGYRAYCMAIGDGKRPKVFLDGQEQKYPITADEGEGMVKRAAMTPNGNMAHDGDEWLLETVYGRVEIKFLTS